MPGVLALLAHPDDEFFCGGLLAAAQARGVPVHLVYWTRGEGGGSPRARAFWKIFPRDWHPRVREAKQVARLLGASLSFLGDVDPAPDPELRAPSEGAPLRGKLRRLLASYAPELVVTHGSDGEYGHPAHQRLHQIARELAATLPAFPLISFHAAVQHSTAPNILNTNDAADFILDSNSYTEKKRNIVLAHRSQKGVLESLSGPGGTLEFLLQVCRYEGYHCWSGRARALKKLQNWTQLLLPSPSV